MMDDVDSSELNQKIQGDIRKVISYLSQIANFRYHLLIYKLVKRGHVKLKDIIEDSGYQKSRIYQIIDMFDSKQSSPESE